MPPAESATPRDPQVVRAALEHAQHVSDARERRGERVTPGRLSAVLLGGGYALVACLWPLLDIPSFSLWVFGACVLAHVVASATEFEVGPGSALPSTVVLVVVLFLLPPSLVPLVVLLGLSGAARLTEGRSSGSRESLLVPACSGWHAVGPAVVFALADPVPELDAWWVLALAVAAQLVLDLGSAWARNCWGLGIPATPLLRALRSTFVVDVLLAPIGFAAALAWPGEPGSLLLVVPVIVLLGLLQRDRRTEVDRALALAEAVDAASESARRDVLTGLSNRLAWEEALARRTSDGIPVGLVLLDVDGLKATNDVLGHAVGDALLVQVADALREVTGPMKDVIVSRLGGDEFGVLLSEGAAELTDEVVTALRIALAGRPFVGGTVPVAASIGAARTAPERSLGEAARDADRAMYDDKALRRSLGA